jgi:hypothetical protein
MLRQGSLCAKGIKIIHAMGSVVKTVNFILAVALYLCELVALFEEIEK